jgi:diaminopimelate decarboxylase
MTLLDMLPSMGKATPRRVDPAIWPMTMRCDEEGRLCVAEVPLTDIANEFGTPAYVIDESDFRHRACSYRKALRDVEVVLRPSIFPGPPSWWSPAGASVPGPASRSIGCVR